MSFLKVSDIFNIEKGSLQSSKCTDGEYDFIVAGEEWKKHNAFTHDCEALIIAVAASGSLGRTHYAKGKFTASDLCFILTPKPQFEDINLQFYYFYFNEIRQELVRETAKGTSKLAINLTSFSEYPIPFFEPKYQNRIFQKLLDLQQIHAQANATLTSLQADVKRFRQSILQQAIQGKLVDNTLSPGEKTGAELLADIRAEKERRAREQGKKPDKPLPPVTEEEMPFELPEGWVWCRLGEICYQITDGTHQTPNYTTNGRIFLSAQNVKPFRFLPDKQQYVSEADFQAFIQNRKPEVDDVLVARIGAGIGEAAVIDREIEFAFYVSLGLVKPVKKFVNPHFIALLFNSSYGVKYSKGSIRSHGASAGNFNLERIRSFPFPLCPKPIQTSTVSETHVRLDLCTLIEKSISGLEERFNRLWQSEMQQIFKFENAS